MKIQYIKSCAFFDSISGTFPVEISSRISNLTSSYGCGSVDGNNGHFRSLPVGLPGNGYDQKLAFLI